MAQRVRVPASSLSSIAVGAGAVWLTDPDEGTLWRVDPRGPLERTIPLAVGAADVAYGAGALWVSNGLTGTVSRIDPRTNRVTAVLAVGNTPGRLAVGGQTVWTAVAGAPGSSLPVASQGGTNGAALPASICGRVFSSGDQPPQRLIVSDLPLRGAGLPTRQMSAAVAYVLRQHGFRAGRFSVGYQSCDDSTAQTGIFDDRKCTANAKAWVTEPPRRRRGGAVQLGLRRGRDPAGEPWRPTGDDLAHQLGRRAHAHRARHRARDPRAALSHGRAQLRPAVRLGGSAGSCHGAVRPQPRPVRRLRARRPWLRLPARGELPEGGSAAGYACGRRWLVESRRAELCAAGGAGGSVGSGCGVRERLDRQPRGRCRACPARAARSAGHAAGERWLPADIRAVREGGRAPRAAST